MLVKIQIIELSPPLEGAISDEFNLAPAMAIPAPKVNWFFHARDTNKRHANRVTAKRAFVLASPAPRAFLRHWLPTRRFSELYRNSRLNFVCNFHNRWVENIHVVLIWSSSDSEKSSASG